VVRDLFDLTQRMARHQHRSALISLWGSKTSSHRLGLCREVVFVDEAAEDWVTYDRGGRVGGCRPDWGRWLQASATVWALLVVVGDVFVQYPS
jgi:hypothetical protein